MFHKSDMSAAPTHHNRDDVETVVGPSVHVEGDFASEGNIVVKGIVSGSVKTSQLLTVEEGAKILASVRAESAIISGHIKGNIKVSDRIELTSSAQVLGDITCQTLVVAPGAVIHGKVGMKEGLQIEDPKTEKKALLSRTRKKDDSSDQEETA